MAEYEKQKKLLKERNKMPPGKWNIFDGFYHTKKGEVFDIHGQKQVDYGVDEDDLDS